MRACTIGVAKNTLTPCCRINVSTFTSLRAGAFWNQPFFFCERIYLRWGLIGYITRVDVGRLSCTLCNLRPLYTPPRLDRQPGTARHTRYSHGNAVGHHTARVQCRTAPIAVPDIIDKACRSQRQGRGTNNGIFYPAPVRILVAVRVVQRISVAVEAARHAGQHPDRIDGQKTPYHRVVVARPA